MLLKLIDEVKVAAGDSRFEVDVFQGVSNPRDPLGEGFELDVFLSMDKALLRIPLLSRDLVYLADEDALNMMKRQLLAQREHRVTPQDLDRLPLKTYKGILIREIHG